HTHTTTRHSPSPQRPSPSPAPTHPTHAAPPPTPSPPFFYTHTAPTEIYTLSLHDALPIFRRAERGRHDRSARHRRDSREYQSERSEEHTSELQSRGHLVCRLLLEKKKKSDASTTMG